jgi:hypothetical protein
MDESDLMNHQQGKMGPETCIPLKKRGVKSGDIPLLSSL